ncbi:hypothetical protein EYF80_019590 [Liparis tanakae]|uniref:Uncharacterized protein n=1 Tax=Liparis tanakae TaxID=230148 RepID=A0A4Z2HWM3_9TELE|nr:hypothetical protein EYF80_019590 [Liparis tanakae]
MYRTQKHGRIGQSRSQLFTLTAMEAVVVVSGALAAEVALLDVQCCKRRGPLKLASFVLAIPTISCGPIPVLTTSMCCRDTSLHL